jgi:anti-sigma-K factor RskA
MTAMDHGSAHERIEDLLLDPTRLAALPASTAPEDIALREHLAGCPACQADLDGWARLHRSLADALPTSVEDAAAATQPIDPPASLRTRVLTAVRSASAEAPLAPIPMASGRRRWTGFGSPRAGAGSARAGAGSPRSGWLAMAAALVVLVVGAGILAVQAGRLSTAQAENEGLTEAIAAVDRVLAEPDHRVVALTTPQGAPGGSISWTRHDLVVLTTALQAPKPGEVYRCWLNSGGEGWAIGKMYFSGSTAYWVGSLDEWASFEIEPTTMFRVSLEPPGADPAARAGPIVLEAALGSS